MPAVLLKIGCETILLPDDKGLATVLRVLARGRSVWDRTHEGKIKLRREDLTVSMSMVRPGCKVVPEDYQPTPEEQGYVKVQPKRLENGTLLLGNGDLLLIEGGPTRG